MNLIKNAEAARQLIDENEIVLIYFASEGCSVCSAVKPKIEDLLKSYPKIKSAQVNAEQNLPVAAEFSIFTIPAILLFIEGKEIIREARNISVEDINDKIERYYNLYFI